MVLRKRVEVLFDPEKFSYLEQIARREKTSVGNLIREAVAQVYLVSVLEKRQEAVQWLTGQEIDFGADWEQLKSELERGRLNEIIDSDDEDVLR